MGLGISDMQAIIFAKVGQGLEGDDAIDAMLIDKVAPLFSKLWAKWEWKGFYPQLQILYVERECIEVLMGQMRDLTDTKLGTSLTTNQSMIFTNLGALHARVETQIAQAEMLAVASRTPVVGELRKRAMGSHRRRPWLADPSSSIYRGDPLSPNPLFSPDD